MSFAAIADAADSHGAVLKSEEYALVTQAQTERSGKVAVKCVDIARNRNGRTAEYRRTKAWRWGGRWHEHRRGPHRANRCDKAGMDKTAVPGTLYTYSLQAVDGHGNSGPRETSL